VKKLLICSIPMKKEVERTVYASDDLSLPVSDKPYMYPINSFLSQKADDSDEYKVLLLVKNDGNPYYEKNAEDFKKELGDVFASVGAKAEFVMIDTEFSGEKEIPEQLMGRIVDEIEVGDHIMADITYGPKELPIVIFSALGFAEKFLECDIDNIVYGKADFEDGKVVRTEIWDMSPLYYLSSVTNTIQCDDPEKARKMLKSLLSL